MTARMLALGAVLFALLGCPRAKAQAASSEARTSLVWIYGDDDALGPPDARAPPSPAASIGDRAGYDTLATGFRSRYTGRENRVELRLGGAAPGFVPRLSTRAELAVGVFLDSLGERSGSGAIGAPVRAEDEGSFVEAWLRLDAGNRCSTATESPSVAVRLMPLDGDRERVGWLEALGWGGSTGPDRASPYATASGPVRAGRLELRTSRFGAFAGLKTASFIEPVPNAPAIEETSYGAYGGFEARPIELVALGLAGGYFEHGVLERTASNERAITAGGSARIVVRWKMEEPRAPGAFLGPSDDLFRAQRDALPGAFAIGVEVTGLVQRLADFDRPGQTALAPARALALFGGARVGAFEVSGALMLRDAAFVMRSVPGVFPGQTIPRAAEREAERTVLVSNGFVLSELARIELALALRFPAAVMLGALDRLGEPVGATIVLHAPGDVGLLPPGAVPVPVFELRPALELRLSRLLSAVGWLGYRRDYNRTRLVPSGGAAEARGFATPDRLGYGVGARALW